MAAVYKCSKYAAVFVHSKPLQTGLMFVGKAGPLGAPL
jgi:hypothetical protein